MTAKFGSSPASSRHYEQEAEASRARLNDSLDQIAERLTPGQILDEILTYAKAGNKTLGRAVGNAARENPIPTLLVGAGCLMALSDKLGVSKYVAQRISASLVQHGGAGTAPRQSAGAVASSADSLRAGVRDAFGAAGQTAASARDRAAQQADRMSAGIRQGASTVGNAMDEAADAVRRTAHDVRDQIGNAAGDLKQGVSAMAEKTGEYASAVGEGVAEATGQAMERGAGATRYAASRLRQLADEQPLLVGALGLALGAAIAAALPATRTENELMGEASDAVKKAASETASEQLGAATAAAGRVVQEVKSAAEQEGLTPGAAAEAARDLSNKVKEVAAGTADAGMGEIRKLAGTEKS